MTTAMASSTCFQVPVLSCSAPLSRLNGSSLSDSNFSVPKYKPVHADAQSAPLVFLACKVFSGRVAF